MYIGRNFCLIIRVKVLRDSGTDHVIFKISKPKG